MGRTEKAAETQAGDFPSNNDDGEELGAAPYTPIEAKFPLDIRKAEFSMFELHRRWQDGVLRLDPDFQRTFVWPEEKQIKLVESVLALIPLPVIYLSDNGDSLEVVDGQQRLTSLFAFMEGRFADREGPAVIRRREADPGQGHTFALRNLRLLKEFNDATFERLDPKTRRKFEETQLTCFVLHPKTSPAAKFELFERINEGTTPLNPQEIRNALYRGSGLELVKKLAGPGSRFRQVAGSSRAYSRMRADELVLRGLAFSWRGWERYKGDLKEFLNDSLKALNDATDAERDGVELAFLHAIDFAERVFGDHAWQRYDPQRNEWSGHISGPLVEAISTAAGRVFPDKLPSVQQATRIQAEFQKLCGNTTFTDAILTATQTARNVKNRMELFEDICRHAA
jgi:hypothetical protein